MFCLSALAGGQLPEGGIVPENSHGLFESWHEAHHLDSTWGLMQPGTLASEPLLLALGDTCGCVGVVSAGGEAS